MFIATGPGITPGRLDRVVSVMDFAPTFCAALDVKADGFDGVPIPEIAEPARARMAVEPAA
jgi:arylsulfatase A-like enzyme